ncbi:MAG: membrane lipoprotein lipid attachment site-containing protein [Gemmatimonadota bacterium]|nr:MAG: membrane lipoprotein lipid attachment site-containing protein [Gemmatimonadota bacterium]
MKKGVLTLIAALALSGCSSVLVTSKPTSNEPAAPESAGGPGPSTAATLGIPPGHLPAPGQCRVWLPGVPPGHQGPSGDCAELESQVPLDGWLVYRPSRSKKEVKVSVYDSRRPNVVVVIRFYDANRGTLLREEAP